MRIPETVIDPAAAASCAEHIVAFRDDDWDHWDDLAQATTYRGRRGEGGRWSITSRGGVPVDWAYADDEIIVLGLIRGEVSR